MDKRRIPQDTARVIVLALAFFGLFVALGWTHGVFERLGGGERWALGLFALGFAIATCFVDDDIRAWLRARWPVRKARAPSPGRKPAAT